MIRPFQLRDLPLLHRLGARGVALHTESTLTGRNIPLWDAVRHLFLGDQFPTYVWKARDGSASGFVRLRLLIDAPHAQIVYLGAKPRRAKTITNEIMWGALLEDLVVEVGRQGIHSLEAEVSEVGAELPILRRAGFAVYTRQDIWVLRQFDVNDDPSAMLRRRRSVDDWDIQLLYSNTVPRLIQLVEPAPPLKWGEIWVLREDEELTAFIHVADGPSTTWLRFFLHPNTKSKTEEIVTAALRLRPPTFNRPLYCCVRRYQSWLQTSLESKGFQLWGSQAVMVKHTVQRVEKSKVDLTVVLESPVVRPGPTTLLERCGHKKTWPQNMWPQGAWPENDLAGRTSTAVLQRSAGMGHHRLLGEKS